MRLTKFTSFAAAVAIATTSWLGTNVQAQVATADSEQATQQKNATREERLKRITYGIKYMASDEMGGRQPGTPGIKLCEDYIVQEYKKAGLKPLEDGTYFQEMEVRGSRGLDKDKTSLTITGPDGDQTIELGKDYQQLMGRGFDVSGGLVFVGYGIKADKLNYDDYADLDVKGKVVVLIRMEPQQDKEDSVFDGKDTTQFASARTKARAALDGGAVAILMVNDSATAPSDEQDDLISPDRFGTTLMPFAQIKRSVINKVLAKTPLVAPNGDKLKDLSAVEKLIDSSLEPISQEMEGWSAKMKGGFKQNMIKTNNIVGVIEGEGPNADETIVIGGHYDHLGTGDYGSRASAEQRGQIHNGADDNATGTEAVIELARRFQASGKKPGRRLVFICFTAEEMGLLGAQHYVQNPIFPLEKTVVMINFDMIGWLRDDKLTLYGWNTSEQLAPVFDKANEGIDLDLYRPERGFGGSDHLPFNARRIPNTFIHTGTNAVYHTPDDDFEAINCEGALRVIDYSENVIQGLASMETAPIFGKPAPFRLGVLLDDENETVTIEAVTEDSAAKVAGLQKGDVVLEFAGEKVTKRRQVNLIVRRDSGKTVKVKLKRGDKEMTLDVLLKKPGK